MSIKRFIHVKSLHSYLAFYRRSRTAHGQMTDINLCSRYTIRFFVFFFTLHYPSSHLTSSLSLHL